MAQQPAHIRLSIASPAEIERTARHLMAIRDGYLTTGTLGRYVPRPLIMQSWQRCQAMQVNPGTRIASLAITHETELQDILDANELLIRAASPVMSYLIDFFADSGYAVVLSDAQGCLLQVVGDAGIIRRLTHIDFVPGGKWSEDAAGTNAIGTTLADGHVVQLLGAEHFCDGWQDLTCTATPIRHPITGAIIGSLDITANYRRIRPFLTSFLVASALEVQQELCTLLTTPSIGTVGTLLVVARPQVQADRKGRPYMLDEVSRLHASDKVAQLPHPQHYEQALVVPTMDDVQLQLNQQKLRANDAERLARAAGTISASLDSHVALEVIAEQVAHLLCLEGAAVGLFSDTSEEVSLHTWCKQHSGWLEPSQMLTLLFSQAREATALIRERGEPVIVDDILSSPLLPAALSKQLGISALVLFPLVTARGVIGFLLAPKRVPYHWVVDDVRLGLALAAQAATALENASLFSRLQLHAYRIELLHTVAQCLNTLPDPNQCLNLVLDCISTEMNLDVGMILLHDQHTGNLTAVATTGWLDTQSERRNDASLKCLYDIARSIIASGDSLLVYGAQADNRGVAETAIIADPASDIYELLAVPVAASTTILGVLFVGSCSSRGLTDEDLTLCTTIGQQLGLNLKNAQLLRSMSEMEALREADRLKSGFLAAVSHDLRSPLTAIRTSVESLLDAGAIHSIPEQEHLLHNIAGQTSRLGQLVDQLLDLSRIEAGALPLDRDWTDLPVLITDTIARFVRLNKACSVEHDLPDDLPLYYVDPTRFAQVIWNLLENAHKYDPSHAPLRVQAQWSQNEVTISVADHGPGIPAGEREKVFQRFYRLTRDNRAHTQGSGLGLAICRGIVEALDGRIWVEDRPGGGSTFRIALPLADVVHNGCETLEEPGYYGLHPYERRDEYGS